ncbi:MAG TPA: transketolase C-terminal domain-containing protein [Candidatus Omnitrophota bacterium]|nr:transketolase C-terminal domain-containing protein [Candidatus Omnitrophota bacterium]
MRMLSYSCAINEAFHQIMESDERVFQIGVGVNTPWYVGNTLTGLLDRFGERRMIDTPVSECGITGISIGAALTGLRPILTFPRMDFMYYAMDQIFNHAAIYNFSLGGHAPVPLVIRAIINRGGEQAAQHSQALQAFFMHAPGFKVVMPSNAYDAKGMLMAAVKQDDPLIFIEDRWLYEQESDVPQQGYTVPLTGAKVVSEGKDATIVASSYMVEEAKKAVESLRERQVQVELIDLRAVKPIDHGTVLASVRKTGRLLVVDGGWETGGIAAEVGFLVANLGFQDLKAPIERIALPDSPAPASCLLEKAYYPTSQTIVEKVLQLISNH